MILGLQPSHYRHVWDQTQKHAVGHNFYLHNTLVTEEGCDSLLTPPSAELAEVEPNTFHYFELYMVTGPKATPGFYRWSVNESFEALASRKGWSLIHGPRLAEFQYYTTGGSSSSARFHDLRVRPLADDDSPYNDVSLRNTLTHHPQSNEWMTLVCILQGLPEIQDYRPVLLLDYAPTPELDPTMRLYLGDVDFWCSSQSYWDSRYYHDAYRGHAQRKVDV